MSWIDTLVSRMVSSKSNLRIEHRLAVLAIRRDNVEIVLTDRRDPTEVLTVLLQQLAPPTVKDKNSWVSEFLTANKTSNPLASRGAPKRGTKDNRDGR